MEHVICKYAILLVQVGLQELAKQYVMAKQFILKAIDLKLEAQHRRAGAARGRAEGVLANFIDDWLLRGAMGGMVIFRHRVVSPKAAASVAQHRRRVAGPRVSDTNRCSGSSRRRSTRSSLCSTATRCASSSFFVLNKECTMNCCDTASTTSIWAGRH